MSDLVQGARAIAKAGRVQPFLRGQYERWWNDLIGQRTTRFQHQQYTYIRKTKQFQVSTHALCCASPRRANELIRVTTAPLSGYSYSPRQHIKLTFQN